MKPNDLFAYIKISPFTPDIVSLSQCYQPIIGFDALALYYYFYSFADRGKAVTNGLSFSITWILGCIVWRRLWMF